MRKALFVLALLGTLGCGGGGGTGISVDAMPSPDGGGTELTAPDRVWTWVQMPGTACANGNPSGFAVNLARDSNDLFFYFEGGGACYDANTCFDLGLAARVKNLEDVNQTDFNELIPALAIHPLLSRESADNPFPNATLVYVPYCTGDVHSGDNVVVYNHNGVDKTVHHVGGRNTQVFIDALHATLPNITRVWDAGSSAGGFGATINHYRFANAWPNAEVHLLSDCAPLVPIIDNPNATLEGWATSWNWQLSPTCTGCTTDTTGILDDIKTNHSNSRIALLAYNEDAVIKAFLGYTTLAPALNTLLGNEYGEPNSHAFVLQSTDHTMLGSYASITQPGGITLRDWTRQWVNGDAAWTDAP